MNDPLPVQRVNQSHGCFSGIADVAVVGPAFPTRGAPAWAR